MIKFIPISRFFSEIKDEYFTCLEQVYADDNQFEGEFCKKSEKLLLEKTGRKHALLTTSGTASITAMLLAQNIGPGDEVICINYSCPASVQPVVLLGAKPIFVDIDQYGQMRLENLDRIISSNTKAILVTGLYGDSFDYDAVKNTGLPVLNDSAQSFFSKYKGQENTSLGEMSILSFSTNKNVPIFGTYGAVLTDNDKLAEDLYIIRRNGYLNRDVGNPSHIGLNAQPHADKSAQVYCSLKRSDKFQQRRAEIASYYDDQLTSLDIQTRPSPPYSQKNHHKYTIFVDNKVEFKDRMLEHGIECQTHYTYNFSQAQVFNSQQKTAFPGTQFFINHALSIPCSPWHTDSEAEQVIEAIQNCITNKDRNITYANTV